MSDQRKPQIDKFKEAARELGCDESERSFDEKLRRIVKRQDDPKNDESPQ